MPAIPRKLGPYEIIAPLGAGGMGQVFKARDTRLERVVAIKILHERLLPDPEQRARFEREARTIGQIQHPHVCALYDVGHDTESGTEYLVLEYVEGETLAARIAKGPLSFREVVRIGAEIAQALNCAHRRGVVHRDLKPGNIMITAAGAKLLDFGIAKAIPAAAPGERMALPLTCASTITSALPAAPITQQGAIVGTFQYMSPEQVEGRGVDARSDVFALGAVLYEMTTGRRAFPGDSPHSVATAILEKDPEPASTFQPLTPPALEHVITTCLAKDPEARWQNVADVAHELGWTGSMNAKVNATARRRGRYIIPSLVAAAAVLSVGLFLGWLRPEARQPLIRASINPPAEYRFQFTGDYGGPPAVSPDGSRIVFAMDGAGGRALWVRVLSAETPYRLAGTENAAFPFWSPDSRFVAFFAGGYIKKVYVERGGVTNIVSAANGRGGTWGRDGTIIYAPGPRTGLSAVAAEGGSPRQLTNLTGSYTTHRWPFFLEDGTHFLYYAGNHQNVASPNNGIFLGSVEGTRNKLVLPSIAQAQYASGRLLYYDNGALLARKFDASSGALKEDPVTVAEGVQLDSELWRANFTVSGAGILVYQAGAVMGGADLIWRDWNGKAIGRLGERDNYGQFSISPDGRRVAVSLRQAQQDLWILEVNSGRRMRLTFGGGTSISPVWSPEGARIAYGWRRDGSNSFGVYVRSVAGSGEAERLVEPPNAGSVIPLAWSSEGKYLLYYEQSGSSERLLALPLFGNRKPFVLSDRCAGQAAISPDGRWVAYDAAVGGNFQIMVTSFPHPRGHWQVSNSGAVSPSWSPDGKQVLYLADSTIYSAKVDAKGEEFLVLSEAPLFRFAPVGTSLGVTQPFRVAPRGDRILVNTFPMDPSTAMTVIDHWTSLVARR